MEGSIDRIFLRNDSYIIGGWAFKKVDGAQKEAEFFLNDGTKLHYKRVARGDCGNGAMAGFEIEADHTLIFALISKKTVVVANVGEDHMELPIWRDLEIKCKEILIAALASNKDEGLLEKHIIEYIREATGTKDNTSKITSNLTASVGAKSLDDNVIVGRNGNLFLYKGNNDVHRQYTEAPTFEAAKNWISLLETRCRKSREAGIIFLQIIIPEKQSVYTRDYPIEIPDKTPLFEKISREFKNQNFYIDPTEELRNSASSGTPPFKKIDSHFSMFGTIRTLELILSRLGHDIQTNPTDFINKTVRGDLGEKLFKEGGLREETPVPLYSYIKGASEAPIETKSIDVSGHIGTERGWINERPLINKSVTVFGNSFFERGNDALGLSFWFSRIFRETNFYWTPVFDEEIAIKNSSDIIICQTVERFLKFLPKD